MPLTRPFFGLFMAFFSLFQPIFGQTELASLLPSLSKDEKKTLAEFILFENTDSLDRRLEQLFSTLSSEQKSRALHLLFDGKEIDGQPIRTLAQLSRDTIDFGSVRRGDLVSQKVELQNVGSQPFLLSKIISPCGCLTAIGPENLLAPGQKAPITVALDSEKTARGPFSMTVVLRDNSSPNQRTFVHVRAQIF